MLVSGQAVPQQRGPWGFIYSIIIKNVLLIAKKKKKLYYFRALLKMGGGCNFYLKKNAYKTKGFQGPLCSLAVVLDLWVGGWWP